MLSGQISIRKRLLRGVIGTLLVSWVVVSVLVYQSSAHEIDEIYDAALASYARVLAALMNHEAREELETVQKLMQLREELGPEIVNSSAILSTELQARLSSEQEEDYLTLDITRDVKGHPYESKIAFFVRSTDGRVLLRSLSSAPVERVPSGFDTVEVADERWRVFGLADSEHGIEVVVGENVAARAELKKQVILNSLAPFLLLLPAIALLVLVVITKQLKPLKQVAEKVSERSPYSLELLSTEAVPTEILPLVGEINELFARVDDALENEQRFTANAAHELRTPLAALKTHAQVLQMNASKEDLPAIEQILHGVDRLTHLVDQLLTLARAEARAHSEVRLEELDIVGLAKTVMNEHANAAISKNLTLSFASVAGDCLVNSEGNLLHVILRNLLDNAIRYTPEGGRVDVELAEREDRVVLSITDSGPGIEAEKMRLMFQRFQRGEGETGQGVGLGLFIVKEMAELLGIEIETRNVSQHGGLQVSLYFNRNGDKSDRPG